MKVKIKRVHPDAAIPVKKYGRDFCYDAVAVSCEEIAPNVYKYRLGIALQVVREPADASIHSHIACSNDVLLSVDVRPRSSVWETGMVLSNCLGTVDENFTGEISVVFYHVFPNMPRYKAGDRVCQLKIGLTVPMEFVEVEEFSPTDRGSKGYGSTGLSGEIVERSGIAALLTDPTPQVQGDTPQVQGDTPQVQGVASDPNQLQFRFG